ncbi:chorismate-binding protein [Arthrospiribacter ruber]|uniref:Isochorismate synthase n=1 Tax=Arthrospiribacter ruber TaxID=2487934 RepID=A0A951IVG9_9BACT|nr:chorismate-binding protein [Arthrospiribacter ruber]MBW3466283.1 isochorismate synthase [Arthrospiribacter ruber]
MKIQTLTEQKITSLEQYLSSLIAFSLEQDFQIAVWRKPNGNFLEILIDKSSTTKRVDIHHLEELKPGFIAHPFEDQKDEKGFFIEADSYFKIDLQRSISEQSQYLEPLSQLFEKANGNFQIKASFVSENASVQSKTSEECSKQEFINLVKLGIEAIQNGELNKIVPARIKKKQLPQNFDLVSVIKKLIDAYPNAFINFFHIPKVGTWIGASPEILIRTRGNEFYTMSLAGTQKAQGENPLKNAAWTQKEIEEQALVSRYIVDCFKKIRLREYDEHGPKTVLAGNLLHLRSDFKVDMEATNFPQLGSVMLGLLHPTSAVCGMPRKEAFEFLSKHESFDRSLFAGFIGPVNVEEETSIYVNLRTARLTSELAILYAGAGVTEDSDPEKEWEETEMKCDIIGKHLN